MIYNIQKIMYYIIEIIDIHPSVDLYIFPIEML